MELLQLAVCILLLGVASAKHKHKNPKYAMQGKNDSMTPTETLSKYLLQSPAYKDFRTPFDPLSSIEMRLAAVIVRAANNSRVWQFDFIGLQDPDKSVILPFYLNGTYPPQGSVPRKAHVVVIDPTTRVPSEIVVNLDTLVVESWIVRTGEFAPVYTITDDANVCAIAKADSDVIKRLAALGYSTCQVVCDDWGAGYVADNPKYAFATKLSETYFYAIDSNIDNMYAHPFDFVVLVDLVLQKVLGIENLPIQNGFDRTNRTGNSVPTADAEYFPDQLEPDGIRKDVKPIKISQPNGTSYTIRGREISWQFFKFIVGYNPREGPHIHLVSYNDHGQVRPVAYRLSVSEIWVCDGDPRPFYQTKSSFDEANWELGSSINELAMHQFCRGDAYYFDTEHHDINGQTWTVPNSICVNEEDDGILWASFDYNRDQMAATRSQRLTVSFYDGIGSTNYWFSWRFYQDGSVELSVKNTGTLSTNLMAIDVKAPPYGGLVSPGVYSQHFQHHFAARIDTDIGGPNNTCSMVDIVRVAGNAGSKTNPYGNGITTQSTVFNTAGESPSDYNQASGRFWRVSNPSQTQPLNGNPISYKLMPQGLYMPSLLTENSPLRKYAPWTNHNLYALQYNANQIFAQGYFMDSGVANWTAANPGANINNTDIVLWYVFSYVHLVELEDYPIISTCPGDIGFRLRPSNFFSSNPALSVPPASVTTALDGSGKGPYRGGNNEGSDSGYNYGGNGNGTGYNGNSGAGSGGYTNY